MSYLSVERVSKYVHRRPVLSEISFSALKGSIVGFTGANGSGKSMLFRAIAGLVRIDSGRIVINSIELDRSKPYPVRLGIALESSGFWDYASGLKNLKILSEIRGCISEEDVADALRTVGLDPDDERPTAEYSMGMLQRLNIAQAIMERPDLLILDEPTNALDIEGIELISGIVKEQKSRQTTTLIACHNQPQLEELFDTHIGLRDGHVTKLVDNYEEG